jgi:hypothetical protein
VTSAAAIQRQFRTIEGLSIRFAESDGRDDHALLLSPWPESRPANSVGPFARSRQCVVKPPSE